MRSVPPGFRRVHRGATELVVAEPLWEAVRSLPLLERDGLERVLARASEGARGRDATALLELEGSSLRLVIRRLRHGGAFGPLLGESFLGLGRPLRELAVTDALRRAGAPVPRPAFVVGRRRAGFVWRAVVATVQEVGTVDALAFLRAEPGRERVLRACAAAGAAVRRFHDAGGRHADLHVKNLLLREAPSAAEVIVIDLDKARVTPGLTPGERMAQIMRLLRSLVKRDVLSGVGPRGCARFFGSYCGDDRALRRALWSRVDRELRKVAVHAWRYADAGAPPRPGSRARRASRGRPG